MASTDLVEFAVAVLVAEAVVIEDLLREQHSAHPVQTLLRLLAYHRCPQAAHSEEVHRLRVAAGLTSVRIVRFYPIFSEPTDFDWGLVLATPVIEVFRTKYSFLLEAQRFADLLPRPMFLLYTFSVVASEPF
jgi:hypothetical protein